ERRELGDGMTRQIGNADGRWEAVLRRIRLVRRHGSSLPLCCLVLRGLTARSAPVGTRDAGWLTVTPFFLIASVGVVMADAGPASAQVPDPFQPQLRLFLDEHCVACHGPEVQKRRLRLDQLPSAFDDQDIAATWVKVLDKLARGEMPPQGQPRPAQGEARAVVAGLRRHLHAASLDRQRHEGRVVLRRLNRTEYETTLRDLLATPVDVKDLLPDDNVAAGFDNVSAVLDISAEHLLRYQGAAEKAVRAVIPKRPRVSICERRTGRQITEKLRLYQELLGKSARLDGDTLILYLRNPDYIPCATAPAPAAGRYRVRVCA